MSTNGESSVGVSSVPIHFGAEPAYLISGLSADVSAMDCSYDLVDNSIDAARNELLKRSAPAVDEQGLPSSYVGFHVNIELTGAFVLVRDDCSGMERNDLSHRAFAPARNRSIRLA